MVTEVLLEPFTTSHLQGQISPSQFTKCANICLHLPQFILLQQNEYLDTFKVLSIMVLLLPQVHCISLPKLMQTGQETLMTSVPPQAILSTLALIPLPGQPKSNPQSLDHPQSQNTGPLPSPQQNSVGFEHSSKILAFFSPIHQSFGVITFLHLQLPLIQCFMLERNILRLISILFEREFFAKTSKLNLFPLLVNSLTSSPKVYPHNASLISNAISRPPSL